MIMIIDIDIDHDDEDEDNEDGDDDDEDIDDDDEEKLQVCASKVCTSAEFERWFGDHDDENDNDDDNEDNNDDDDEDTVDNEEKRQVCASKVYTSAEFKREKDNFQSLCKNLERTETKRSYAIMIMLLVKMVVLFHSLWKKLKWIEIKKPTRFHAEQMLKSSFDPQNGRWPHDLVLES